MAHPYTAWRLAEEHRNDLLRTAEEWRLVHPATVDDDAPLAPHAVVPPACNALLDSATLGPA